MTVDRIGQATGEPQSIWTYHHYAADNSIAILYADPILHQHRCGSAALGTAKLHTWTSFDIKPVFRGQELRMKANSMGTGHKFSYAGREFRWRTDSMTMSTSTLYMERDGQVIARYRRKPGGMWKQSQTPTLELFIPVADIDMDMFCVTALASAAHWAKEKKEGIEAASEILGAM